MHVHVGGDKYMCVLEGIGTCVCWRGYVHVCVGGGGGE